MLFFSLICFGFSAICFYGIYAAQLPQHPSSTRLYYLLSVVGICVGYTFLYLTLQAIQNLPHHSSSLPYYFALGVGLCGESTSTYMWTQRMEFPCAIAADLVSLLVLLHILLSIGVRVGLNDKRRLKFC